MIFKRPLFFILSLALFLAPKIASAAIIPGFGTTPVNQVGTDGTLNDNFNKLWENIVTKGVFPLLSGLAVIFLIVAGYQYVTAGADAAKTKKARQNIINVILGVIVLIATYTIIGIIIGAIKYFAAGAQG